MTRPPARPEAEAASGQPARGGGGQPVEIRAHASLAADACRMAAGGTGNRLAGGQSAKIVLVWMWLKPYADGVFPRNSGVDFPEFRRSFRFT